TLEGIISVDGESSGHNNHGGGSGGSVWIETGVLTGSGIIRANGGVGGNEGGGGGGGRIAIYVNSSYFGGVMQAYGSFGREYGGPGTIYLAGSNKLVVHNDGNEGQSAGLTAGQYEFDTIELSGYGHLTVISHTSVLTLSNGTLVGDGTARLTGEGIIAAPSSFDVVTATIVVAGDLVGPEAITITDSGGLELHAHTP
ncbi:MAG: hypothetical protein GY719_29400, partial [bacterium]|nr:hypothetical protein [bacterium]